MAEIFGKYFPISIIFAGPLKSANWRGWDPLEMAHIHSDKKVPARFIVVTDELWSRIFQVSKEEGKKPVCKWDKHPTLGLCLGWWKAANLEVWRPPFSLV